MKKTILELLNSKRVWITIAGAIVYGLAKANIIVSPEFGEKFADLAMVLVGSFAITGAGKEAKALEVVSVEPVK